MARWSVAKLFFAYLSAVIASENRKVYEGYKVYDIKTKSHDDLTFLRDLEITDGDERSLDFLSLHNNVGDVARLVVMPEHQNYIENMFESRNIGYIVKTSNLQE